MHRFLEQSATCIAQAVSGGRLDEFQPRQAGKWNAAEIVEHLTRAYASTNRLLQRQLASGSAVPRRPTWRERCRALMVIEAGYFPKGVKAPEFTRPRGSAPESVLPAFREALRAMDEILERCEQRFGHGKVAAHFLFGPLSVRQWRKFHWVHTRHHAAQIARLRTLH